jgi:hypothetical protein
MRVLLITLAFLLAAFQVQAVQVAASWDANTDGLTDGYYLSINGKQVAAIEHPSTTWQGNITLSAGENVATLIAFENLIGGDELLSEPSDPCKFNYHPYVPPVCPACPSVSSHSGTFLNGQIVTINGTKFGPSKGTVVIGNAYPYDRCTKSFSQASTSWKSNKITIQVNQGDFSIGSIAYVYVTTKGYWYWFQWIPPRTSVAQYAITFGTGAGI